MNTQTQEALKLAIEQMQHLIKIYIPSPEWSGTAIQEDCYETIQACKEALAQPAQEPLAWISVKDRFPKEMGRYLVYVEEIYDLGNAHYIWNAGFNPNDGVFQEETMKNGTVTHWMNLPNTPNGISHYINPTHSAPLWQGLSDDEITQLKDDWGIDIDHWNDFARTIEQALRNKNVY